LSLFVLILIIIVNDNDYHYHFVAVYTTKKCIGPGVIYVYVWL